MSRARTAKKTTDPKKPPAKRAPVIEKAPRVKWVPSEATQFIVGGIAIIFQALCILSNTNGDITVAGDDVWILTHWFHASWNYFKLAPGRGYLMPFYDLIYDMVGQNTQRTHIVFFVLLVSSAILFYIVLHKLLGPAPAVVGAIFYLGYSGKYETITWIAAGAYLVCANVLFLSVWIAMSDRLNPWVKGAVIAAINWLAVLLYEIMIAAAPLYPFLYWLHHRLRRRPMPLSGFAATFLPLLAFGVHMTVMYLATDKDMPLPWQRGFTRASMTPAAALGQLWPTFRAGFSEGLGSQHLLLLQMEIVRILKYVPRGNYEFALAFGVCASVAFLFWFSPVVRFDKAIVIPLITAGVYLALFSPLIGFSTFPGFVPSRLLTLVGVGLALLTAAAAAVALTMHFPLWRYGIPVMLFTAACIEGAVTNSILYEHQTAWQFDSRIRTQLLVSGIKPQEGDTIFISLPPHPLEGYWHIGFSQFSGGHIGAILSGDYGLLRGAHGINPALRYLDETRRKGTPHVVPVARPGHELFCFSVDDNDYRLTRTDCH